MSMKETAMELSRLMRPMREVRGLDPEFVPTPDAIAIDVIMEVKRLGWLEGSTVMDLGCGTGMLGVAALLFGADHVTFVDNDETVLGPLAMMLEGAPRIHKDRWVIEEKGVEDLDDMRVDIVLTNPPFGAHTGRRGVDAPFMEWTVRNADGTVFFVNGPSSGHMLGRFRDSGWEPLGTMSVGFPLPYSAPHHTRASKLIPVTIIFARGPRMVEGS